MNDLEHEPGPLPDELKAFFTRHRRTGNATPQQLKRLAERLELPDESALERRIATPNRRLRSRAIIGALALAAAGLGVSRWVDQRQAAAMSLARTHWTSGDGRAAMQALEGCSSDGCIRLRADLTRAAALTTSVSILTERELSALVDLYEHLATADGRRLAGRVVPPEDWSTFTRLQRELLLRSGVSGEHTNRALAAFERGSLAASLRWAELAVPSLQEVVALVPGSSLAAHSAHLLSTMPGPEAVWTPPPPGSAERLAALLVSQVEREPGSAEELLSTCLARLGDLKGARCLARLVALHEERSLRLGTARDAERALALNGRLLAVSTGDLREAAVARLRALRERFAPTEVLLALVPGERREFLLPRLRAASTSVPTVATVEVIGGETLRLTAVAEGTTALRAVTDEGEPREWRVTVQRALGRLRIASTPTKTKVFIDGVFSGRETPVLPSNPLTLPVGRHRIHFEGYGKKSPVYDVVVTEGDNPVVRGALPW